MKSLMSLLDSVLQDCSTYCGTTTTKDYDCILGRVKHEGISFLTITLGNFAQDFERSLELGYCDASFFQGFGKMGTIPKLFSGMFRQVFNPDGKLLDEPSEMAVLCIRQVCRMWKKILLPCTAEREAAAEEGYIQLERKMSMMTFDDVDSDLYDLFLRTSDILWTHVFSGWDSSQLLTTFVPRHGTGATALKVLPNQKYDWREWHQRLDVFFPSDAYCYHNAHAFEQEASRISYVAPDQERPVRVVFVPKTQKTPRVIGIEPACMQYAQQALLSDIVGRLEKHPMTSGHVNFEKQSINARLALESSKTRHLATLDLSEASDRVHKDLVYAMLRRVPHLRDAIFACRSMRATSPSGITVPLAKFASMGSALCFPIESMVFYSIIVTKELQRCGLRPTPQNVKLVSRNVYVYGDDIIIPTDAVPTVTHGLESFGLKVNSTKSFSKGNFRESCGMDAFNGIDVTPVYIRRLLPSNRRDVSGLLSAVSLSNQLFSKGFFKSASEIERQLSKLGWKLPYVTEQAACVGFVRDTTPTIHRRNVNLQRPEVKGFVIVTKKQDDPIDGNLALMKWFLQGLNPDRNNYLRTVGSGRLTVKVQWTPVFR